MFRFFKVLAYIIVPLAVGFGSFQYLYNIFFVPLEPGTARTEVVLIRPNIPFSDVCDLLVERGVTRKTQSLCLYRQLSGSTAPVTPGEYELSPGMTPKEILQKLQSGERFLRKVVLPEGSTIEELDLIFSEAGFFKPREFDAAARDPQLLSRAGIGAGSFEGYLGMGEYSFAVPVKPVDVLWELIESSEQQWEPRFTPQLDVLRISRHEILTLASIIQETTGDPEKRRIVSSVLHNRLQNGMRLESPEALSYGIRDFDGTIDEEDRASPSPYNTFLNYGLPPGPILNPGKDAIEAALFPAETANLFYGRTPSGELVFSETAEEHEQKISPESA
ncbi:endolytic transglycosylase MltG [bacterium]|nr:endolytic transglycosylase MltG [bacterium]